jgi:CheY-like chemotaxis protein
MPEGTRRDVKLLPSGGRVTHQFSMLAEFFGSTGSERPIAVVHFFLHINPNVKAEKKRILAVDDQASNTRLVKLYLEQTNDYVVREENDPKAALTAAEEFQPHLILLDVMMPGMDGWDLVGCFRANRKLTGVPVVFLTAAITKGEVDAIGGRCWGYPFLAKPVVLKEMLACLKKHLGVVGKNAIVPPRAGGKRILVD